MIKMETQSNKVKTVLRIIQTSIEPFDILQVSSELKQFFVGICVVEI